MMRRFSLGGRGNGVMGRLDNLNSTSDLGDHAPSDPRGQGERVSLFLIFLFGSLSPDVTGIEAATMRAAKPRTFKGEDTKMLSFVVIAIAAVAGRLASNHNQTVLR